MPGYHRSLPLRLPPRTARSPQHYGGITTTEIQPQKVAVTDDREVACVPVFLHFGELVAALNAKRAQEKLLIDIGAIPRSKPELVGAEKCAAAILLAAWRRYKTVQSNRIRPTALANDAGTARRCRSGADLSRWFGSGAGQQAPEPSRLLAGLRKRDALPDFPHLAHRGL